jgi:hypothetical protein
VRQLMKFHLDFDAFVNGLNHGAALLCRGFSRYHEFVRWPRAGMRYTRRSVIFPMTQP